MKFAELKTKEVVSLSTGKKIGFADDIIIDELTNMVVALRVPKHTRGFRKPEYIEIPFCDIEKIGENVILVREKEKKIYENFESDSKDNFFYTPKIFKRAEKLKNN